MSVAHPLPQVDSPHRLLPRLVTWLRCNICQRGYFAAGAPGSQRCQVCAGGRLQPVGLWHLRTEATPPGMIRGAS